MKEKQLLLIVEDELVNRKILNKILKDEYEVIEAANGLEAWDIITESKDELSGILLDLVMPKMNGFELLDKMNSEGLDTIPVIVATGGGDEETEKKTLDAGAWDFVTKPYNGQIILSRLKNAIARSQLSMFDKLKHMAEHDRLTGMYNREKMFAETKKMIVNNPDMDFYFLRLDIDHFAMYNSSFGEIAGDKVIKYMGQCVEASVSGIEHCVYGRMNADVFCICAEIPKDDAIEVLEKKSIEFQKMMQNYRNDYLLEVSIGVVDIDDPQREIDEFYTKSNFAAQKCKNLYEKYFAVYDEKTGNSIETRIAISNEMQQALDEEQFIVYLQPKFSLSTDSVCGAEALVRWLHPERGLISPGKFIPVFESNGFISKLDYYVWDKTCAMLKKWSENGNVPFPVSVNISRISMYNPKLSDMMVDLVQKYDIPPSWLQLELTESAYISNPELMEETIQKLHKAGFTLLMDDFGSGYSSLNTLKTIDVDILKVDMKFLPVDDDTEKGEIILACVIKMANWLGMEVVIEGVETTRQRNFLEGAGCDCVQGFYYSKPIPNEEYESKYAYVTKAKENQVIESTDMPAPKHNQTILVIDDSEIDRVVLTEYFNELYYVKTCEGAEEGLAYLKNNYRKVRLILVDNVMPGMSGMEFLKYCQQTNTLSAIPKIMITANDSSDDQVEAFKEGAYDYITKPLTQEIVMARVNHVMDVARKTSVFDAAEQATMKQAELDASTKLLNKLAFKELAGEVLVRITDEENALMVINVDDFKQINNKYGQLAGDKVLQCIAKELTKVFGNNNLIGRISGDEMAVLMSKVYNQEAAQMKATDAMKAITIGALQELQINVTVSIGLSFSTADDTIDTLFARANAALLDAKNSGKERITVYGEKVTPIIEDGKPIILVCGTSDQVYPAVALAYGSGAAFAHITSFDTLKEMFRDYKDRIKAICLDVQSDQLEYADEFYDFIIQNGGGKIIPILAICREGNMDQVRRAMLLDITDVITLPPQTDIVKRKLSKILLLADENIARTKS